MTSTLLNAARTIAERTPLVLGVLPGEGSGPELITAALTVLKAVEDGSERVRFAVQFGGAIGDQAIRESGGPLSRAVIDFCRGVFAQRGAILAGAGGDRFVYESRREFGLYTKWNPLVPSRVPLGSRRIKPEYLAGVDILIVRENLGGVYQGQWHDAHSAAGERVASQQFSYSASQVERIVQDAARLAAGRRGHLAVVTKSNGVPTISRLWLEIARATAQQHRLELQELDVDLAVFLLVQEPRRFDVIVTPNLFGDILADVGGVLLGSRGLCYGASFSTDGAAVYQTNHGAAHDLAGTDRANPVGQILSLAMMLRTTFGLAREAAWVEAAIEQVWGQGLRTDDLAEPGCTPIGTQEMARQIAAAVGLIAGQSGDRE